MQERSEDLAALRAGREPMRFPSEERFLQYCISKRRTYLRQLFEKRSPVGFFELWKGQYEFARGLIQIEGISTGDCTRCGHELLWLLSQDLHQVVRSIAPDFPPVSPSVIAALPGALLQARRARSMLVAGPQGVGKEQLAILLHVLTGRPGALVRLQAADLSREPRTPARQLLPERGTVFISAIEGIDDAAQEDLLGFLNGEARRRDLLFIVSTSAEPRSLVPSHGLRRDLFVRMSQTEVRIQPLRQSPEELNRFLGGVLFDLVRIPAARMPQLRAEARDLSDRWGKELQGSVSSTYDLFAEALSYVMWRARKELVPAALPQVERDLLLRGPWARDAEELRERVADAFDEHHKAEEEDLTYPSPRFASSGGPPVGGSEPSASAAGGKAAGTKSSTAEAPAVPTSLSRDELLRVYYRALVIEERGDLRRIATRAGRRVHTLQAELARLGVRLGPPLNPTSSRSHLG